MLPMVPSCYINPTGRRRSSLLCGEGLKLGMPAAVNNINFSAVNLPSSSAVPVDDGKIAAQKKSGPCIFVFGGGPNLLS